MLNNLTEDHYTEVYGNLKYGIRLKLVFLFHFKPHLIIFRAYPLIVIHLYSVDIHDDTILFKDDK